MSLSSEARETNPFVMVRRVEFRKDADDADANDDVLMMLFCVLFCVALWPIPRGNNAGSLSRS